VKIICIEEHAVDPGLAKATLPIMQREAPYMSLSTTSDVASVLRNPRRPTFVELKEATALGLDLGQGRIRDMNEQRIEMQVMSYSLAAQLVPRDEAVSLAAAANDRFAGAIAAHPDRLSGFAALPWQDPEVAVAELTRAINELDLKGALITGRPGITFLEIPSTNPFSPGSAS